MDLVVVRPVQAGGDPPPEDPPLGPALDVLGVLDPLMEHRPEGLDPDLVEREAAARPEAVAGEVAPARLVPGALGPVVGQVAERLPEGAQGRRRPVVARDVEDLFQPLDQPGRAGRRAAASAAGVSKRGPDRRDRRVDSSDCSITIWSVSTPRHGWCAGAVSPVRPGRGAGSGAASGGRRSATGTKARWCRPRSPGPPGGPARARPSPCGRPASGSASGGSSRIESGSAAHQVAGPVLRAAPSCWPAGRRPAGPSSRSKSRPAMCDLVPLLGVAGDDAEPGLRRVRRSRSPT